MPKPSLQRIHRALVALEQAGYQLDALLEPAARNGLRNLSRGLTPKCLNPLPKTGRIDEPAPEDLRPQEPVAAKASWAGQSRGTA